LGINDAAALRASGGGGSPIVQMLRSLVLGANAAPKDPTTLPVVLTMLNFASVDPMEMRKQLASIAKQLGGQNRANSVLFLLGGGSDRVNAPSMLKTIYEAAAAQGLDPRFLTAAFFGEVDWSQFDPKHLDSFDFVGMDRFLKEFDAMLKDGTIRPGFEHQFKRENLGATGETGESYKQRAKFNDLDGEIRAFAALLKHRRVLMLADLADAHVKESDLTADELDYWNYVYYNGGSSPEAGDRLGTGKKHLIDERIKKSGPSAAKIPSQFIQPPGDGGKGALGQAMGNAQRVLAIKRLIQWAGMVDPSDPSTQKLKFVSNVLKPLSAMSTSK